MAEPGITQTPPSPQALGDRQTSQQIYVKFSYADGRVRFDVRRQLEYRGPQQFQKTPHLQIDTTVDLPCDLLLVVLENDRNCSLQKCNSKFLRPIGNNFVRKKFERQWQCRRAEYSGRQQWFRFARFLFCVDRFRSHAFLINLRAVLRDRRRNVQKRIFTAFGECGTRPSAFQCLEAAAHAHKIISGLQF